MEIRAGQRPPRSKPEDQTSLSASTGLLGKCWKVFFNENMEKKINKDKMMKKKNGRESIFFYTCRRNFQVQSCGQAMAPEMLLQRGGCSTVSDIFIYFPPQL